MKPFTSNCDLLLTGFSLSQRMNLRGFDILQNIQIGRLCDIKGKNPFFSHIYTHQIVALL